MPQPFRFRLQTALELRERREGEMRRQFAIAERVLREVIEARGCLRARRAEVVEQVRSGDPEAMLNGSRCLEQINRQLAGAHALVERQAREAELQRQRLLQACQDREALSRLRERRLVEHDRLAARTEARELDEIAMRRARSPTAVL